ncbi:MAG: 50S ribosomal protein L30 [Eubacteriales bacterium]
MAKISITLVKSLIGQKQKQIKTAESLGLKKIGDRKVAEKDVTTEGKINVISHLVTVEEVSAGSVAADDIN